MTELSPSVELLLASVSNTFLCTCLISQLIYKKTILPCPLPFFYQHESNMSMNGSDALGLYVLQNASALAYVSEANGPHLDAHAPAHDSLHSAVQFTPRPEDHEDMCTPKYFVFNSQVTFIKHVNEPVRRVCSVVCSYSKLMAFVVLCVSDCVHHSNPRLCIRVSSWSSAHLQRTERVRETLICSKSKMKQAELYWPTLRYHIVYKAVSVVSVFTHLIPRVLQSLSEEDAECLKPVHLGYAGDVPAVRSVRLSDILRYVTLHLHTFGSLTSSHIPVEKLLTLSLSVWLSDHVEAELLHTFTKVYKFDTMLLLVRLAVLTAVTLTVPIVLFPVSNKTHPYEHVVHHWPSFRCALKSVWCSFSIHQRALSLLRVLALAALTYK